MAISKIVADNAGKVLARNVGFPLTFLLGEFAFSSSYTTGGEDFNAGNYFSKKIISALFVPVAGKSFEYNPHTGKVIARKISDGVEVSGSTDLSGVANQPELQELTIIAGGGDFDIGVGAAGENDYTAAYDVSDSTLKTELGNLSDVEEPTSVARTGSGTSEAPYVHSIEHSKLQEDSNIIVVDDSGLTDVPQVTDIEIDATGGTFKLSLDDVAVEHSSSEDLPYNISAADLQTAINALTAFTSVAVSLSESVYTITFEAGNGEVAVVTDDSSLSGGDSTAVVDTTTDYAEASVSIENTQDYAQKDVGFVAMGWS